VETTDFSVRERLRIVETGECSRSVAFMYSKEPSEELAAQCSGMSIDSAVRKGKR
jgi:hypothetical protein